MNPFSLIFSGISTVFGFFKERAHAKQDLKLAEIEARKQMVLSREQANSEWELAQLADKDKVMRWSAFLLFASPLLASFISPQAGAWVQHAWHSLEPWQADGLSAMCLAVFGYRSIPRVIGNTVNSVAAALRKPRLPPPV